MHNRHETQSILTKMRRGIAPFLTLPLMLIFISFILSSCLSTQVIHRHANPDQKSGILIRVFQNSDSAKAGVANAHGTLTELFKLDGKDETFLQRSLATEWGIEDLEPGKYRLRIPAIIDNNGNIRKTQSGDRTTDFVVKQGQTSVVKVILKETPTGLIIAATVTVVFIVVALAFLLGEHDIHPPPLVPPIPAITAPLLIPPRPVVVSHELLIVHAAIPMGHHRNRPSPRVTSVLPNPGTTISDRFIVPTVTFSQPIDESTVRQGTIKMLGSKSGVIQGNSVYKNGLLRFTPKKSLIPGESITVTVYAGGVINPEGRRMAEDFSWVFTVTR